MSGRPQSLAVGLEIADRIVFMDSSNILEQVPPQAFFENPTHPRTQDFLGRILS